MSLTREQKQILGLIKKFIPTEEFGINQAFFRTKDEKTIDFLFIVDKDKSPDSIAYIQSFVSVLQKSSKDMDIELSIYVHEKDRAKELKNIIKDRDYKIAQLSKSLFAVPA